MPSAPAVNVMGLTRNHLDVDFTGSTYQMKNNTRQITNNPHGHDGAMPTGNYLQTNIASSSLPGTIATDADNNWNAGGSQAAAVDGHVYSALVYDWWLERVQSQQLHQYRHVDADHRKLQRRGQ